jgi:hypothetical protein
LEFDVGRAINNFIVGCKADGIWDAIKASCILAGARTLSGALVPLAGTAPTNVNFVSGDYNRKTGLVGNGTTKYLDSNRNSNTDPQNNCHTSVFVTSLFSATQFLLSALDDSAATGIYRGTGINVYSRNSASLYQAGSDSTGLAGGSRNSSASANYRVSGVSGTVSRASNASSSANYNLFRSPSYPSQYYGSGRLAFYSIGESLDLALLDARVTALITAFGVAIP